MLKARGRGAEWIDGKGGVKIKNKDKRGEKRTNRRKKKKKKKKEMKKRVSQTEIAEDCLQTNELLKTKKNSAIDRFHVTL